MRLALWLSSNSPFQRFLRNSDMKLFVVLRTGRIDRLLPAAELAADGEGVVAIF